MRRSPLARRTPLKRTPMKAKPKRRRSGDWAMPDLRAHLLMRDRGCVAARLVPDVDCSAGLHVHHVLMRSQGGRDIPEHCVIVCDRHHGHIHANPAESYILGLLRRRGS